MTRSYKMHCLFLVFFMDTLVGTRFRPRAPASKAPTPGGCGGGRPPPPSKFFYEHPKGPRGPRALTRFFLSALQGPYKALISPLKCPYSLL